MNQSAANQVQSILRKISDQLIFYSVILVILLPLTLLINGFGTDAFIKYFGGTSSLVASGGCSVSLDVWYISLTVLCCVKLLIQGLRYMHVRTYQTESVLFNLGGNFVFMPVLFAVFFIYTQRLFENSTPEVKQVLTPFQASISSL